MQTKTKRRRRQIVAVCAAVLIIILVILHFQKNVNAVIVSISDASIKAMSTVAVNEAVYYTLSDGVSYDDLINIEKDNNGKIVSLTANSLNINQIARDTAYLAQQNLKRIGEDGIYIPLGALAGINALAGFGPKINIKIIPIGTVFGSFLSQFRSAGINQTNHRIILEITAEVSIITPTVTTKVVTKTEVLLCESLIIGDVPKALLTGDLFAQRYNLS